MIDKTINDDKTIVDDGKDMILAGRHSTLCQSRPQKFERSWKDEQDRVSRCRRVG